MSTLSLDFELALGAFDLSVKEELPLAGITGLFGPSGAGKTSLLRVIAGLEPSAKGRVEFDGTVWQDAAACVPAHRRNLGFVFQDGRLFPHLDVKGNLRFALGNGRHAAGALGFDDVVAALDLEPLLDRGTSSLSGGERQRVAIGRALLAAPRLLLMDEPASSLDLDRRREVVRIVETLPERFGLPVVYVTHDVDELVRLADDVVVLRDGRVVGRGPVTETLDLSDSLGAGSVVQGIVESHSHRMTSIAIGAGTLRVPRVELAVGRRVRIRVQARDVVIAVDRPEGLSIRNVLPARVEDVAMTGRAHCLVGLAVGRQRLYASITQDALEDLELAPGLQVYALIKSVALDEYPLL